MQRGNKHGNRKSASETFSLFRDFSSLSFRREIRPSGDRAGHGPTSPGLAEQTSESANQNADEPKQPVFDGFSVTRVSLVALPHLTCSVMKQDGKVAKSSL